MAAPARRQSDARAITAVADRLARGRAPRWGTAGAEGGVSYQLCRPMSVRGQRLVCVCFASPDLAVVWRWVARRRHRTHWARGRHWIQRREEPARAFQRRRYWGSLEL